MSFTDWSTTNSSNTAVGPVNIAEGCPPGNLNDAIREVMAELATFFMPAAGGGVAVTAGGTGATTAAQARTNLSAAASGANADITSLTGLTTPLAPAKGGTGVSGVASSTTASANGYMKLYNGIIIQWGKTPINASGSVGGASIIFPAIFPNACWTIVGNADNRANGSWLTVAITFQNIAANGVTVLADTTNASQNIQAGVNVRWIAIGN